MDYLEQRRKLRQMVQERLNANFGTIRIWIW